MPYYDKDKIREQLETEQVFELLDYFNGEPEYSDFGIISQTICHNEPGDGSRKLYYYKNNGLGLFHCYSGDCDSFDIFELVIKCMNIQKHLTYTLYDAMNFVASYFGIEGEAEPPDENVLEDWNVLKRYDIGETVYYEKKPSKIYDKDWLNKFAYLHIYDWEKEGISYEVCEENQIGYYPGGEQITIPHFDMDGNLIGIRGRALIELDAERFGKYRPIKIGNEMFSHPLSLNLYGLNTSKDNIKKLHTAIVFEGEKSVLLYESIYGINNSIAVACCGSNLSTSQFELLKSLGVTEIIIAFDKQFKETDNKEFSEWTNKLTKLAKKYQNQCRISFVFDKENILGYKSSPIDEGKEKFEYLLNRRFSI